jgi:hypothetical protein
MVKAEKLKFDGPEGAIGYLLEHLGNTTEGGHLEGLANYRGPDGRVRPYIGNHDLWKSVGLDLNEQPPIELLWNLLHGMDGFGNVLTRPRPNGEGWQPYKEVLFTYPTELGQALGRRQLQFTINDD